MNRKRITRRVQRMVAFQVLFQLETNPDVHLQNALLMAIQSHLESEGEESSAHFDSEEAFFEAYPELKYSKKLILGVQENKDAIDALIEQHASAWKLNRVIRMDLILLRMAIFEMKFISDDQVPDAVALNEALEIAKIYSDEKSTAFINGILSNLVEK